MSPGRPPRDRAIAHRGLWRPGGAPENSLAAFEAACAAGYGMELDVQLTADGRAVVFHDPDLKRMTGVEGRVRDLTAGELNRLSLHGSDERIPTLEQALALIAGRGEVYVELKTRVGEEGPLERAVARALDGYAGAACVVGFNPAALERMKTLAPQVERGLSGSGRVDLNAMLAEYDAERPFRPEHLAAAAPRRLIVGKDLLPSPRFAAWRAQGLPVVAWTLRSPTELDRVATACDAFMFEGFTA